MSNLLIWIIVLVLSIVLFLINHYYVSNKADNSKFDFEDVTPIQQGEPILGTMNMIGITIHKGYRFDSCTGAEAGYSFLTIFLPLIPLNCYLLKEIGFHRESHKKSTTSYKFYGYLRWNIWEILFIYFWWYSWVGGIVSIIAIICEFV